MQFFTDVLLYRGCGAPANVMVQPRLTEVHAMRSRAGHPDGSFIRIQRILRITRMYLCGDLSSSRLSRFFFVVVSEERAVLRTKASPA